MLGLLPCRPICRIEALRTVWEWARPVGIDKCILKPYYALLYCYKFLNIWHILFRQPYASPIVGQIA